MRAGAGGQSAVSGDLAADGVVRWNGAQLHAAATFHTIGIRVGIDAGAACGNFEPDVQGQDDEGGGPVTPQEQRVIATEPAFQGAEPIAIATGLDLSFHRCGAADVEIDIGAIAAVVRGAGQRHALGAQAGLRVDLDDGALAAQALVRDAFPIGLSSRRRLHWCVNRRGRGVSRRA